MVFPLLPLYAESLGCTAFQIGMVVGSFSLLSMFLAIPIGKLLDKKSAKWTFFWGVLCNILYSALLLLSGSLWTLMLAQILGGMGFLTLIVSSQAYISGFSDKRHVEKSFGYLSFAAALGQTVGPYLGGRIITHFNFAYLFALALIFAVLGLLILKLREVKRDPESGGDDAPGEKVKLGSYLTDLPMLGILLFTFVIVFTISLRSSFIPVLFKSHGLTEETLGLLLSLFALFMTLIRLLMSKLLHKCSRVFLVYTAFGCVFAGISILPHFSGMLVLGAAMIVMGIGFGISQPLSMVMVSDRAAGKTPGTAMGLRFTTITVATFLSPLISGGLVESLGLETAFYLPSVLIMIAVGFILFIF